ncbi:MAG: hypothetical protein H7A37_00460 [Chlamydiales bacterium]|nr:hypothetical protein [Chlamydiia bacterium]MCP5506765.1 hypothetical protein [Chlamydiales bacterium]
MITYDLNTHRFADWIREEGPKQAIAKQEKEIAGVLKSHKSIKITLNNDPDIHQIVKADKIRDFVNSLFANGVLANEDIGSIQDGIFTQLPTTSQQLYRYEDSSGEIRPSAIPAGVISPEEFASGSRELSADSDGLVSEGSSLKLPLGAAAEIAARPLYLYTKLNPSADKTHHYCIFCGNLMLSRSKGNFSICEEAPCRKAFSDHQNFFTYPPLAFSRYREKL